MDHTIRLHFHWFTNSEADPCQTAAVQMVDGSDLRAHADLQEWPRSGSGDVCWLTAVPKLAPWQLCCWGLSVLAGHRFDPDPTSLTSWQDFCSEQQCWHWHTNPHTHVPWADIRKRLADWQIFHHPVQRERFRVLYETWTTGLLQVSAQWWLSPFKQHKCADNVSLDTRSHLSSEGKTSI